MAAGTKTDAQRSGLMKEEDFKSKISEKYRDLDHIDKEILKHLVTNPGINNSEIGTLVGLNRNAISRRRNREKFKKAHADYLMEPLEVIKAVLKKAAHVAAKTLEASSERLRFEAAYKILTSEGILKKESDTPKIELTGTPTIVVHRFSDKTVFQTEVVESKPTK